METLKDQRENKAEKKVAWACEKVENPVKDTNKGKREVIIWLKKRKSFGKWQEGEEAYGRSITHPRMNRKDIKIKILEEGKESGWGLHGSCCSGGSNRDSSLQFLVRTLCWLHTDLDKSFFCKWQDQATRILFNQPGWLRDNISACMYPPLNIDG